MQRIDLLKRKIKTATDLRSIVKTMKGLAAVSINQYEHAVDSINQYYLTIEQGLQIILQKQPGLTFLFQQSQSKSDKKRMSIIFGAGQPMCGAFNEVLATFFHQQQIHFPEKTGKIIAVGHRITSNLDRYGSPPDHLFEMPTTIERINETVQSLVVAIQQWYAVEGYTEAYLFYNRPESNAGYKPVMEQLLPIDMQWLQQLSHQKWKSRTIPTFTMDETQLVSALIKQLLFVSIHKTFSESLSAENNSRLAAMQVAEKKIDEMIEELTKAYRNQRQTNITEELLDIIASFEVLQEDEQEKPRVTNSRKKLSQK